MKLSYHFDSEYETKNPLSVAIALVDDSDLSIEDLMEISSYLKIYASFRMNEKKTN